MPPRNVRRRVVRDMSYTVSRVRKSDPTSGQVVPQFDAIAPRLEGHPLEVELAVPAAVPSLVIDAVATLGDHPENAGANAVSVDPAANRYCRLLKPAMSLTARTFARPGKYYFVTDR